MLKRNTNCTNCLQNGELAEAETTSVVRQLEIENRSLSFPPNDTTACAVNEGPLSILLQSRMERMCVEATP